MAHFVGTCVELPARLLEQYDDTERTITYRTFLKHVGKDIVKQINDHFSVPLSRDWAVRFGKGKWRGKPAVCMHHSSIHHIYVI